MGSGGAAPEGAVSERSEVDALPTPEAIFDLTGRSALVSGATGAFGQEAARALAGAGAHVTLAGGNEAKLAEVANGIVAGGGAAATVARRPATEDDVEAMVDAAVSAGGGLDILVAGSGTNIPAPIVEQDPDDWDAVMDANVRQAWLLCRAAGRVMIPAGKGGKVILMSSTRGSLGLANYTAYCPSKAAVELLTKALAVEWGPHGINVNALAPTVFRSDLTAWMYAEEGNGPAVRENMLRRIPLGRLGEPTDFHGAVLLLASSASDFMTGSVVYLDGGYTAG
jgi:NAD(P)-dependent dehydrogenase (short-subunit alcohol dehydrogenase family)